VGNKLVVVDRFARLSPARVVHQQIDAAGLKQIDCAVDCLQDLQLGRAIESCCSVESTEVVPHHYIYPDLVKFFL